MPGSNIAESLGGQSPASFLEAYRQLPWELHYLSVLENYKNKNFSMFIQTKMCARFLVLTAVTIKTVVFWGVLHVVWKNPMFWRNISPLTLLLKSKSSKRLARKAMLVICILLVSCLDDLLFEAEDGNDCSKISGLFHTIQCYNSEDYILLKNVCIGRVVPSALTVQEMKRDSRPPTT